MQRDADVVDLKKSSKLNASFLAIEPVDAEKVSSPTEPYALISMNALGNLKYAAPQQPAPTPREATSAAVRPP